MVLQGIQPRLNDIVYDMAATKKPFPLKGDVESFGNHAPVVDDDCREVHIQNQTTCKAPMQVEQPLFLHNNTTIKENPMKRQESTCD